MRLFDRREVELPDVGPLIMEDAETGEQLYVDTHDKGFRERFREAADRREATLRDAFKQAGVDAVSLSTDEDLVLADRPDGGPPPEAAGGRPMSFIWPAMLLLLLAIPLGAGLYLVLRAAAAASGRRRTASRPAVAGRAGPPGRAPAAAAGSPRRLHARSG